MRLLTSKYLLIFILFIAMLGLPVLEELQARGRGGGGGRGGGAHVSRGGGYRGGGMGGGGFQGVHRPGPGAGQRPGGGGSVQRPGPGAGRPGPGGSYQGGSYQRNVNVDVDNNWHRGRYGYGRVAGAVAVGATVAALSAAAQPVVYGGTTYYVDGDTYYKQCYQGDEAAYCVVENPNP
jgi:hypothetical protein